MPCFADAAALMSPTVTPVTIPFEGTALNGYLYQPPGGGPAATCVMHGGFDSTAEEWHHIGALAARQRGYTVITFDGPGHPGRTTATGWCSGPTGRVWSARSSTGPWPVPRSTPARIALFGLSMGGGLAPRAAAFEPRLAALVCIDGIYDIGQAYTAPLGLGADTERRLTAGTDPELDATLARLTHTSSQVRWGLPPGHVVLRRRHAPGVPGRQPRLPPPRRDRREDHLPDVRRPRRIDHFLPGQPEELMAHLTAPATLASFTDAEGAGAHAQVGAQRPLCARMLDWLDQTLAGSGARPTSSQP